MYPFFAFMKRMKYVRRWSLMRNSQDENLLEHSHETAMLAHALAVIGNKYFGKNYDVDRTAVLALYHDSTEIITGDMPTPVKYANNELRTAYKNIEANAAETILSMLPDELCEDYRGLVSGDDSEEYRLVKYADKLSAYVKCVEERKTGSTEFLKAEKSILKELEYIESPELRFFMERFLPAYELSLDEQT